MNATELLTGPLAQALGWALLHLLWQAAIVAGILAALLGLMTRQSANARYVTSCGALALVFFLFVATAIRAYDPAVASIPATGSASPETIKVALSQLPALLAETAAEGLRDRAVRMAASARGAIPSIVAIWLTGVVLLTARLLVSWMRARHLLHHGTRPANAEWQRLAAHLSNALGLRRAVTLLESAAIEVPSVIGSLRPIILLPASALTGLTTEHLEMVLAHEMAHIRRHDFLLNLLQALVETLMFYHPAVWWMSRRVRIERENCCDDLAVAVCGNPIQYARALTRLEELRASALPVLVAANGGSLLERIRRIAAGRAEGTAASSRWAAGIAMLSILIIAIAVPSLPALAQREEKKAETAKPAEAKIDVVETQVEMEESEDAPDIDIDPPDVDIDPPNIDIDPPDIDMADFDFDYEPLFTPEPPGTPVPALAPRAMHAPRPMVTPMPAIAPMAVPSPMVTPRPPRAPRAPTPRAMAAMDHAYAFTYEPDEDGQSADREIGADGKLSVDELIALRSVGVTPAYVNSMRDIFPGLTLRGVTSMRSVDVTPEYVQQMRAAGFEVKTPRDATSLSAVGVTPGYVREMRAAGLAIQSARDASSLRAVGVSPEYIQQMRAAGFEVKTARDATNLRAVDVTPEYVKEMRAAGLEITNTRDASSLRAVGVSPEWVRELRAAGVEIKTAKDATSLAAVGVSAQFVKRLANAGYTNLTPRELSRLAAAGVDDDFIREMQQYRKKN